MDVWDLITPDDGAPPNPFDGACYCVPYETLLSLRRVCVAGTHEDRYGRTDAERLDGGRIALVHTPHALLSDREKRRAPLLLFFHGLGDHPWEAALRGTGWRRMAHRHGFIAAFAVGTDCGARFDRRCGFRVRDPEPDIAYAREMIAHVGRIRSVDETRIYCVGFSNGAIFSSVLAQRCGGDVFAAMANIMGGFGKEGREVAPEGIDGPVPLLFVTGTLDDYRDGCERAHDHFCSRGYPSSIRVLEGVGHTYPAGDEEERVWAFLCKRTARHGKDL
jgi:poly(3-hydroxybutyrate) depolymerase